MMNRLRFVSDGSHGSEGFNRLFRGRRRERNLQSHGDFDFLNCFHNKLDELDLYSDEFGVSSGKEMILYDGILLWLPGSWFSHSGE